MKFFLALTLALLVVLPAAAGQAPPFPWKSYTDVPPVDMAPACGGAVVVATINAEWKVFSSETRDMFVHLTDGVVDYVYFTVGVAGSTIKVTRVLPVDEALRLYPDACAYLTEKSA
jgi:hypothetical protein